MTKIRVVSLFLMVLVVFSSGCTTQEATKKEEFRIVYPREGMEISHNIITISFEVGDFDLNSKEGSANKEKQGRVRVWMDDSSTVQTGVKTAFTFYNVSIGEHTINVELVNNDGSSFSPAIRKTTTFRVIEDTPRIKIVSPLQDEVIGKASFSIDLYVERIALKKIKDGRENVDGEGHIWAWIDKDMDIARKTEETQIKFFTPERNGTHTVFAELRQNDGSQFEPPIIDSINITVNL